MSIHSVHYAIDIDLESTLSSTTIGMVDGHLRYTTEGYDPVASGATYESGGLVEDAYSGEFIEMGGVSDFSSKIDLVSGGDFAQLGGVTITLSNALQGAMSYHKAITSITNLYQVGKSATIYTVIDDVFYTSWSGVVDRAEFSDSVYRWFLVDKMARSDGQFSGVIGNYTGSREVDMVVRSAGRTISRINPYAAADYNPTGYQKGSPVGYNYGNTGGVQIDTSPKYFNGFIALPRATDTYKGASNHTPKTIWITLNGSGGGIAIGDYLKIDGNDNEALIYSVFSYAINGVYFVDVEVRNFSILESIGNPEVLFGGYEMVSTDNVYDTQYIRDSMVHLDSSTVSCTVYQGEPLKVGGVPPTANTSNTIIRPSQVRYFAYTTQADIEHQKWVNGEIRDIDSLAWSSYRNAPTGIGARPTFPDVQGAGKTRIYIQMEFDEEVEISDELTPFISLFPALEVAEYGNSGTGVETYYTTDGLNTFALSINNAFDSVVNTEYAWASAHHDLWEVDVFTIIDGGWSYKDCPMYNGLFEVANVKSTYQESNTSGDFTFAYIDLIPQTNLPMGVADEVYGTAYRYNSCAENFYQPAQVKLINGGITSTDYQLGDWGLTTKATVSGGNRKVKSLVLSVVPVMTNDLTYYTIPSDNDTTVTQKSRAAGVCSLDLYLSDIGIYSTESAPPSTTIVTTDNQATYQEAIETVAGNTPVSFEIPNREQWIASRYIEDKKDRSRLLTELCMQGMAAGYSAKDGSLVFKDWVSDASSSVILNDAVMVEGTLKKFTTTALSKTYNEYNVKYDGKTIEILGVADNQIFPPSSGDWASLVVGVSDYSTAKEMWGNCRDAYVSVKTTNEAPSQRTDLTWCSSYEWAVEYTSAMAAWASYAKYTVDLEVPITSEYSTIEIADRVELSDPIITPDQGEFGAGWIVGYRQQPRKGTIKLSVMFEPQFLFLPPLVTIGNIDERSTNVDTITEASTNTDTITEVG